MNNTRELTSTEKARIQSLNLHSIVEKLVAQEWAKKPEIEENKCVEWFVFALYVSCLTVLATILLHPVPEIICNLMVASVWFLEIGVALVLYVGMFFSLRSSSYSIWSPIFMEVWSKRGRVWEKIEGPLLALFLVASGYMVTGLSVITVWLVGQFAMFVVRVTVGDAVKQIEDATPTEQELIKIVLFD